MSLLDPTQPFEPGRLPEWFDDDPFHRWLGLRLTDFEPDRVRLRLSRSANTPTGIGGSLNGGVIATMIDMAAVAAVFTNLHPDSRPAGTADLNVTYLRQTHGDWVDAIGTVIKRGRQLCTVEVSIEDAEAALCARGRVLYAVRASGVSAHPATIRSMAQPWK